MNNFCNRLSLPVSPLIPSFNIEDVNVYHSDIGLKNVNPDFVDLLSTLNIKINYAPVFRTYPNTFTTIHSDGQFVSSDFAKLNFIYNEEDSYMMWYRPIVNKTPSNVLSSDIKVPYIMYDKTEVVEIHRQPINGCALVQGGIPHNIHNFKKIRYCLTFTLYKKSSATLEKITMEEAVHIFKQYLNLEEGW